MVCGISFGLVFYTWSFEVESLLCTSISDQIVTFPAGAHSHTLIDTHACTHTHMHVHIHKHVHTHALNTHAHTYMLAHTSTSGSLVYNKMVGDGSENGHSKEKMDNKQNSTECTRNWCFSTLWTRLFGIWMGWSSLPDYPMPLAAGELNSLLWSLRPIDL